MATISEFDAWLECDSRSIRVVNDAEALAMRVLEWLGTPEGSHVDLPGWGHPLLNFRFEPTISDTEVRMEIAILNKLRVDVPSVRLRRLHVEYLEIDQMYVALDVGITTITELVLIS